MTTPPDLCAVSAPASFTHGLTLAYRSFGHGPEQALAFHGFGRTGEDFAVLEEALGDRFTIHAFDLPFHGASPHVKERAVHPFAPQELAAFFTAFADERGSERLTVIGYSLGGRIALSLEESMPGRIARLVLLAPDGLKHRPWYRGIAGLPLGRQLYGRFVDRPQGVHRVMRLLHGTGLMNDRMFRFLLGQTDTREKRELVHDVWLCFRRVEPRPGLVAAHLKQHQSVAHLIFGRHDRVIPPVLGRRLQRRAPQQVTLDVAETGHVLLIPEVARLLAARLGA